MNHVSWHKLQKSGWDFVEKWLPENRILVSASGHHAPSSLSGTISYNCKPKHGKQQLFLLHGPNTGAGHLCFWILERTCENISMDTNRKVVDFRENFIKPPKEMVLQIRDKSLKELRHQTGWGREKRDTLQHFLAHNNPWMTCTHSSSLKHQCCIKFCNVKHMRNI